ncbi:MAG: peptidoglycan editing factor PgeF [Spirochaetales bacterium]|nr:peptidoglycan editing factor PgeF [Spirochaetales bacterium]
MRKDYIDYSSFFPIDKNLKLKMGISLSTAGTMNPFEPEGMVNRENFFNTLNITMDTVSFCKQIHSTTVFDADRVRIRGREGDGLITGRSGSFLSVTAADCMPIYLFDPENGVIGLCHSGWKGTGIALKAMDLMGKIHGSRSEVIHVLLGPSIGACCYEVDQGRANIFSEKWGKSAVLMDKDRFFLDLVRANRNLLQKAGVEHIYSVDECTRCNGDFSSFRREGPDNYTRMTAYMGFIRNF